MQKSYWILSLLILSVMLSACSGLAGEPDIVIEIPTPIVQSVSQTPPDTEPNIEVAAQIFANRCSTCHGATGAGDGELVQSGQITAIPNLTNAIYIADQNAEAYYDIITNGNMEMLMPPFSGSISDEDRWSLANYMLTLAGESPLILEPSSGETAAETADASEPHTNNNGDISEAVLVGNNGTITGTVMHGTQGDIPYGAPIVLHIIDMTNQEEEIEGVVGDDGTFTFTDVPVYSNSGYYVTVPYGDGYFNSRLLIIDIENPELTLDVTVYNTTDDDSVVNLQMVLTQVDVLDSDTLSVTQVITVRSTGFDLYVYDDNNGFNVSVEIPLPQNARLSPDNDFTRFYLDEFSNTVYDTRPVIPGEEHSLQIKYTMPISGNTNFVQQFPYAFSGPFEAYVNDSLLDIRGNGWLAVDNQQVEGVTYEGMSLVNGVAIGESVRFTIQQPTAFIDSWVSYVMLGLGLTLVVLSLAFFLYARYTNTPQKRIDKILATIAELDEQYDAKTISKSAYDKQRNALKTELAELMTLVE
ncbi:MAG: cytochrome c [Chloroflexota bacterium]